MAQTQSTKHVAGFATPPDVIDPTGAIAVWWTNPPGMFVQLTRPARGTTATAEWLVGPLFAALVRRFPEVHDLHVVLDMRPMTGRSAIARALLTRHVKAVRAQLGHVVIIPSLHLGPAYLKMLEASALLLVMAGVPIAIEHNLDRVLDKHGLRAAASLELSSAPSTVHTSPRSNDALL
jgi:hypothetical protein